MDMGMLRSRRAKNSWYSGIEPDRKLVSQLDKLTFKMGRGGGWAKGLEYRSLPPGKHRAVEGGGADSVAGVGG